LTSVLDLINAAIIIKGQFNARHQKVTAGHKRSAVEAKTGNEWLRARITRISGKALA